MPDPSSFNIVAQAGRVAASAATRAGVEVGETEDMADLRAASGLLAAVWGHGAEGVPLPSEVMRSIAHAGGAVTVARDLATGQLAGAAALVRGTGCSAYSLIAAAAPGAADRGIGRALKLRQRSWALAAGLATMAWTFDPLVARNARFNLTKLGARAVEYHPDFYGLMTDDMNGADESDRLVAVWELAADRTVAATEGTLPELDRPVRRLTVLADAPDGAAGYVLDADGTAWCRAPHDIVALRRSDPAAATAWRRSVRAALGDALGHGRVADGLTRDGWYRLPLDPQAGEGQR
jgi:predicted GNAT superfamily acetyltransferase